MSVKVNCETENGGSVSLNKEHGVWASYAVAGVSDLPRPNVLYAGVELKNGRNIQLFVNRDTGLIAVDLIDRDEKGGTELLRQTVRS